MSLPEDASRRAHLTDGLSEEIEKLKLPMEADEELLREHMSEGVALLLTTKRFLQIAPSVEPKVQEWRSEQIRDARTSIALGKGLGGNFIYVISVLMPIFLPMGLFYLFTRRLLLEDTAGGIELFHIPKPDEWAIAIREEAGK